MSIVKFVRARNNFGNGETKEIPSLTDSGAPTTATAGAVGCLYMDTDTGELYKCTSADADADSYIWKLLVGYDSTQNANGLSDTAKNLLITILRNGVYSTNQSANITALETALGSSGENSGGSGEDGGETETVTYTISNELVNATSNNSATSVTEGASYNATLKAADGYVLNAVSVTMGGVDVTADVYADGVINISAVTGDIVITVTTVGSGSDTGGSTGELSETDLLAYFDFRNVALSASEQFAATKGVDGAYFTTSYATTVNDDKGIMLDNGTYGGGSAKGITITPEHFTFAILFYVTENKALVVPQTIGGSEGNMGNVMWTINYLDSTGTSINANNLSEATPEQGKYVFVAYRTTAEQADIFVDGVVKLTAENEGLTNFASWATVGNIRATKNYGNGQITALAYYDRALSDVEIVELGEYFKTLEVT